MASNKTSLYQPTTTVALLKKAARLVERIAPKGVYARTYRVAFACYRAILRGWYARHVVISRVIGDNEATDRAATVLKVMPYSLVGSSGLEATHDIVAAVERSRTPGSIVECGVARGGSAALMGIVTARYESGRALWLFDSYEGLPEPTSRDFSEGRTGNHVRELPAGSCLGGQQEVEALLFDKLKLDRGRVRLVAGWFEDTVAQHAEQIGEIAVLRIDADWYESVKCCLDNLYDSVVEGGYLIIDDYGTCFGAKRAVDEFLARRNLDVQLLHDGRGGCHFVKPS